MQLSVEPDFNSGEYNFRVREVILTEYSIGGTRLIAQDSLGIMTDDRHGMSIVSIRIYHTSSIHHQAPTISPGLILALNLSLDALA